MITSIDDAQHRRGGQEDLGPHLMRFEQAKEPRAFWDVREQATIVACEPPIKRPVAHPFERMEESKRHDLTRPQSRVGMFGNVVQACVST